MTKGKLDYKGVSVFQTEANVKRRCCFQICTFLRGARVQMLDDQKVPYAVKQNEWVGYDNKESFTTKVVMSSSRVPV